EEAAAFQEDTKKLMKSFLDFFIGYGLEFNKKSEGTDDLSELSRTLDALEKASGDEGKEVKIKWKNC
ncbi:MAG: hypothetical protein ACOWWO_20210, partial [Peptococcaceae bacterium]